MAIFRRPAVLALLVIAVTGIAIAAWLAPLVAGIVVAGIAGAGFVLILPWVYKTSVHGPGYQYRDDSSPISRNHRR
jgi:hypothetical protein